MVLQEIKQDFSVCKVTKLDSDLLTNDYTFAAKTDRELSIICPTELVPEDTVTVEHRWSCFRIAEDASFDKYGMIAFLSKIIADEKTSVLVVATFDTDYLFVKTDKFPLVKESLIRNGCRFPDE
ncbi:MAG: ACT domain-containing protein [Clostridium sp.]|nr:ACT domain-containing protein [Clostridium sp.]